MELIPGSIRRQEVLIEHGIVGATGALLEMLFVALATTLAGRFLFPVLNLLGTFALNGWLIIGLVVGMALLAVGVAALVTLQPMRVRLLDVLRYE